MSKIEWVDIMNETNETANNTKRKQEINLKYNKRIDELYQRDCLFKVKAIRYFKFQITISYYHKYPKVKAKKILTHFFLQILKLLKLIKLLEKLEKYQNLRDDSKNE